MYLLDDPLSAVDVHVGGHIFSALVRGALSHAAVLLVTNAVHLLPRADRVLVLDAGNVVLQVRGRGVWTSMRRKGTYHQFSSELQFAAQCTPPDV